MKLNLGCGDKRIVDFLNIDINPDSGADWIGDVSDLGGTFEWRKGEGITYQGAIRQFYENEPVQEIVAYDVIEHFDRTQILPIIKNWFSYLAPGGALRIRTNDLDRMIKLYLNEPNVFPDELFIWHLMCEHEKPGMGHKWCFTRRSLFNYLLLAGFKKIDVTAEEDIFSGKYPHSFTECDRCNMHMTAWKT